MRVVRSLAVSAILLFSAKEVRADDRAAAQVLFEQGRDLVKKGKFSEACPKFAESLRLDRGIGTMLWLADCQENNGQSASAWATFKEAAAAAALANDPREKVARDRALALMPKLSHITINVPPGTTDIEVKRDGVVTGVAEWGVAVPVDPGPHAIDAQSPGHLPWSKTVTVAPDGQTVVVDIPVLRVAEGPAANPPASSSSASASSAAAPSSDEPHRGRTQRIVGVGLGVLGVAALGVGTFLSLDAKSTYDEANDKGHCLPDNRCDPIGTSQRNDAASEARIATIVIGAGLVALAGGVVLYLLSPKSAPVSFSGTTLRF